jgi:hypothetical protein
VERPRAGAIGRAATEGVFKRTVEPRRRCFISPCVERGLPAALAFRQACGASSLSHEPRHSECLLDLRAVTGVAIEILQPNSYGARAFCRDTGTRLELRSQFAMNVRCPPKPIVNAHPPDQRPQFRMDLRPASQVGMFK